MTLNEFVFWYFHEKVRNYICLLFILVVIKCILFFKYIAPETVQL